VSEFRTVADKRAKKYFDAGALLEHRQHLLDDAQA
jgi:hypothetical protein